MCVNSFASHSLCVSERPHIINQSNYFSTSNVKFNPFPYMNEPYENFKTCIRLEVKVH
jgi:hypothetical protein